MYASLSRPLYDTPCRPLARLAAAFDPDDLTTPGVVADPYPAYRALRGRAPFGYLYIPDGALPGCPDGMRAWAAMAYDDVRRVLSDHESFSSARPLAGRLMPRLVLLQDDPPRHTRFRGLVRKAFAPGRIAALEPLIARIAGELLDEMDGAAETDFVSAFAGPLPIRVIAGILGLPESEHRSFRRWSNAALSLLEVSRADKARDRAEVEDYFRSLVAKTEAHAKPGDEPRTLIELLVSERRDGAPLEDWEIVGFCLLLLIAGSETTTNLLGNMAGLLVRRPELWDRLRADRGLIEPFIEESLRFESPLQRLTRTTAREVELGGLRIPAGETVVAFIGAANRDPCRFADPEVFRLDRPRGEALAFGAGIHHCLGAGLARAEARIALGALLDRFSDLAPGTARPRRQSSKLIVLGYETLPLKLTRG